MDMSRTLRIRALLLPGLLLLAGCAAVTLDKDLNLTPEMFAQRQIQTRRFDTTDEQKILRTCAALLQDTGFNIDESETKLGILTASKERDASDAVQWATYLAISVLLGVPIPPDKDQVMKAFITTRHVGTEGKQVAVRVVFERIVSDTDHRITKIEALNDPKMYQSFFEKLSKALFLEAHDI
jgi:predicted DsbA family dithiol-disulfide isomerase